MKRIIDWIYKFFDIWLVCCMVGMFVLIFVNVVLRMMEQNGIDVAEEAPRYLFVWMTFVGAIVAMREHNHVAVNVFVLRMPLFLKKICYAVCNILILVCCGFMFYSGYLQWEIVYETISPVLQISMLFVYGITFITAPVIGINVIHNIIVLLMDRQPLHVLNLEAAPASGSPENASFAQANERSAS
ncbi:ABC transporter permease [Betaproteobacteria bacterium]|nr:ABC transporter permease [Betaproteobacteria bacterium]